MPLNPDDAAALADFDAEMAAPKRGPLSGFLAQNRVVWLRRVIADLKARVDELEAGGVPEVIAKKDVEIAARDKMIAAHAARIAEVEAVKLPEPGKFYRDQLPMTVTPESDPNPKGPTKIVPVGDVLPAETVAPDKKTPQHQH